MKGDKKSKLKYNLNPRGNTWVNDESKKCQKMMEKFGWEKGKGLGRNESGIKENIKANGNMGKKGFGCISQTRDNWLFQQDEYSSILENLNEMYGKKDEQKEPTSGFVDLEENCKKSTSRVYYSKFVRGKNLANRSQKDLDCILGPNRNKETKKVEVEEVTPAENEEHKEKPINQTKDTQSSSDPLKPQTVNMYDYFAQKMAALKKAAAVRQVEDGTRNESSRREECSRKRKHSSECEKSSSEDFPEIKNEQNEDVNDYEEKRPKKKRRKVDESTVNENMENKDFQLSTKKSKHSKEDKGVEEQEDLIKQEDTIGKPEVLEKPRKSKKKKCSDPHEDEIASKKHKKCKSLCEPDVAEDEVTPVDDVKKKTKKSKKNKLENTH